MSTEERRDECRAALEHVIDAFGDVFVKNDGERTMAMPVLGHWVLITTHDDALDPTVLASYRMSRKNMATHETAGLLYLNLQELQRPWESD